MTGTRLSFHQWENFPAVIIDVKRWVVFKCIPQPGGKIKKIPLKINGDAARSDHKEDWSTLDEVIRAINFGVGHAAGIALGSDFAMWVLDLDGCLSGNGDLSPLAKDVLSRCQGYYIEYSISGEGLHVLYWDDPKTKYPCNPVPGLEVYGGAPRFILMTGNMYGVTSG